MTKTKRCESCGAKSNISHRFCYQCGELVDETFRDVPAHIAPVVDREIKSAIENILKEKNVVEAEITNKIVTKIRDWVKLFIYFAAIPASITIGVFVFFGIKTFSDVRDISTEIEKNLGVANRRSAEIIQKSRKLEKDLVSAETTLARFDVLNHRISDLYLKMSRIELVIDDGSYNNFDKNALQSIKELIENYSDFLISVGMPNPSGQISLEITEETPGEFGFYFDVSGKKLMFEHKALSAHAWFLRSATHSIHDIPDTKMGWSLPYAQIQSAISYYFPLSYLGSSKFTLGESFDSGFFGPRFKDGTSALDASEFFSLDMIPQVHSAAYSSHYARVWTSLFWGLRTRFGQSKFDPVLASAYNKTEKVADYGERMRMFSRLLLEEMGKKIGQEGSRELIAEMRRRKIQVP